MLSAGHVVEDAFAAGSDHALVQCTLALPIPQGSERANATGGVTMQDAPRVESFAYDHDYTSRTADLQAVRTFEGGAVL